MMNSCLHTRSMMGASTVAASRTPVRHSRTCTPIDARRQKLPALHAIMKISAEQLETEIESRTCALIIDFFATWCGPCVLLATELEKVDEILGDEVKILKIDVDENKELSSQLGIEGLPTLVFIPALEGKEGLRTEGVMQAQEIIEMLSEL